MSNRASKASTPKAIPAMSAADRRGGGGTRSGCIGGAVVCDPSGGTPPAAAAAGTLATVGMTWVASTGGRLASTGVTSVAAVGCSPAAWGAAAGTAPSTGGANGDRSAPSGGGANGFPGPPSGLGGCSSVTRRVSHAACVDRWHRARPVDWSVVEPGQFQVGHRAGVEAGRAIGAQAVPARRRDHRRIVGAHLAAREEALDPVTSAGGEQLLAQQ